MPSQELKFYFITKYFFLSIDQKIVIKIWKKICGNCIGKEKVEVRNWDAFYETES